MMFPLLAGLALAQHTALHIRESKVDITPPEPLPLGGYTARLGKTMEPGGEKLYARCLLLCRGNWKEAVVSAEMLTIPDSLAREVEKRVPADVKLFLSATHTHSAPDSQILNDRMRFEVPGVASFKHRWLDWYAGEIAAAVKAADGESVFDSRVTLGPDIDAASLAAVEFREDLNRGRRQGADPDTLATALEAMPGREKLFLSFAAHPVLYGPEHNQTSGDWPGELSATVESGTNRAFLVLAGAIGDVSPKIEGNTDKEKVDSFASLLLGGLRRAESHAIPVWESAGPSNEITATEEPIQLDPPVPSPAFIKDYKVPEPLAKIMVKGFAPDKASISAIRLGSLAILGVPGEPTSHLGRRIREAGQRMGFHSVLVISHVNGWIGYILDPVDYSHGGYEASLSFNGPQEGEHVVHAAIEALKDLRDK